MSGVKGASGEPDNNWRRGGVQEAVDDEGDLEAIWVEEEAEG